MRQQQRTRSASMRRLVVLAGLLFWSVIGSVSWAQTATQVPKPAAAVAQPAAPAALGVNKAALVPPKTYTVPQVSGMNLASARAALEKAGFGSAVAPGQDPSQPVRRTDPAAGSTFTSHQARPTVVIFLRQAPPATVVVPNVVGDPALAAEQRVRDAQLRPRMSIVPPRSWHYVAGQSPEAQAQVAPGTEVRLTLVARYRVPALIGRSCDEARQWVLDAGFASLQCGSEAIAGSPAPGRIHRQQPPAGSQHAQPIAILAWTPIERVKVPALVGSSEEAADQALAQVGLSGKKLGPAAMRGRVVSGQSPTAGAEVAPGSEVKLQLALRVPSFTGRSCDDAAQLAREHGFSTFDCRLQTTAPGRPLRRIFEQSPAAGTTSSAPEPLRAVAAQGILVPKVLDLDLADALSRLQALGLTGRAQPSDGERRVVAQAPVEGVEVAPQSEVRLGTVRIATVPDVVGLTLQEGRGVLAAGGFKASSQPSDAPSMRRVVSQRPAAKAKAAMGSTVALTTVIEAVVPDTTGKPLDEARAAIAAAGLAVGRLTDSARAGTKIVSHQTPSPGARAPVRSAVDLTLLTRVSVPDVKGRSCQEARIVAQTSGLGVASCTVLKPSWLPFLLGTPQVVTQSRVAGSEADEGTSLALSAEGAVAQTLAVVFAPLAAFAAVFLGIKIRGPSLKFGVDDVHLRIVADRTPRVTIDITPENSDAPVIAWRAERGAIGAVIRSWNDLDSGR